jgi:hypothetical protein
MPVVAKNPVTGKYVMQFWSGHCGFANPCTEVAFADSPYGPFANITKIALRATPSSQMGFFADADGTAYVKYNTVGPDQHHNVERLAPDWASSTGDYAVLFWKPSFAWMEGGGMFKRGALYCESMLAPPRRMHCRRRRRRRAANQQPPPHPPNPLLSAPSLRQTT